MAKRLGLIRGHMRSLPLASDVVIAAQRGFNGHGVDIVAVDELHEAKSITKVIVGKRHGR